MPKYAFLNPDGVCFNDAEYSVPLVPLPDGVIEHDEEAGSRLGMTYADGEWSAPAAAVVPEVVITAITVGDAHAESTEVSADLRTVDAPVGATLTFMVELRAGASVLPVSKRFRMPLRSADAAAASRLIAVDFVDGRATFDIALTASRHWRVDEAAINAGLGPDEQLRFAGLDVYALELTNI